MLQGLKTPTSSQELEHVMLDVKQVPLHLYHVTLALGYSTGVALKVVGCYRVYFPHQYLCRVPETSGNLADQKLSIALYCTWQLVA